MEGLCKFFNGIGDSGAGENFRESDYQEIFILDGAYACQGFVRFQIVDFFLGSCIAVVIDDDDIGIGFYDSFPAHGIPCFFQIFKDIDAPLHGGSVWK